MSATRDRNQQEEMSYLPAGKTVREAFFSPWILLVVAAGTIIRFYGLGAESLWLDEVISYNDSRRGFSRLLLGHLVPGWKDFNGSLYFALLHLVTIFFSGEFALRFLSALAGSISVLLIYSLSLNLVSGRQGERLGLFAATLLAFSPFHLVICQNVRGYALLLLLTLGALIFMVRSLSQGGARNLLGFALCNILAYYTHFLAILFIFGESLVILWYCLFNARGRPGFVGDWFFAYAVLSAGIWKVFFRIPRFFVRAEAPAEERWWLTQLHGSPGWEELVGFFKIFAIGAIPESPLQYCFLFLLIFFLLGMIPWRWGNYFRGWEWSFGIFLFTLPVGLCFGFSQMENFFQAKYLLYTLPVFYLVAARGIQLVPGRAIPAVLLLLCLITPCWAIHRIHTGEENPDWRNTVSKIMSGKSGYDVVSIHANYNHILFDYYTRNIPQTLKPPTYLFGKYSGKEENAASERKRIRGEISQLASYYRRMWLILSFTWDTDPLNLVEMEVVENHPIILRWPGPPRLYLIELHPR